MTQTIDASYDKGYQAALRDLQPVMDRLAYAGRTVRGFFEEASKEFYIDENGVECVAPEPTEDDVWGLLSELDVVLN